MRRLVPARLAPLLFGLRPPVLVRAPYLPRVAAASSDIPEPQSSSSSWPTAAALTFGFAAFSAVAFPLKAASSDEREADLGDAPDRREYVLQAHEDGKRRTAERRRAARDEAGATPREQLHGTKQAQYEKDIRSDAILSARDFVCGCELGLNCASATTPLITECRQRKLRMTNFGAELQSMLGTAVHRRDDGNLELDLLHGQVHISQGVTMCPLRFRSVFAIREKMWRAMRKAVVQDVAAGAATSMWGYQRSVDVDVPLRGQYASAWMRESVKL